jgi:hypothetical protein
MTRFALLASLLAAAPAWALDLTPRPAFRELEGQKIPVLQFSDALRKINYRPPSEWRPTGGGKAVQFDVPGSGQNSMKLMLVTKPPGTPQAAELTAETVQAIARAVLPKGAENLMLTKETPSPFTLEGRPSLELTFSYLLFAQREVASIAVVDRSETEWFVLLVSARDSQFDTIHSEAVRSMFSWRIAAN